MKNLLAAVSYSFSNFYDNLNEQGKTVFSVIIFLILLLCILLCITYVIQGLQRKLRIKKADKVVTINPVNNEKKEVKLPFKEAEEQKESKISSDIQDIADSIEKKLKEDTPISLTSFEEDQERTAIISIDELIKRAKELEIIEDEEQTGVNYLEKYNLEPAEVEHLVSETTNANVNQKNSEVKAFKVSQIISPVYGVKKEIINKNE